MNASSVETAGVDFSARWAIDAGSVGTLTPSFTGTYIRNYDIDDPQAGLVDAEGRRNFTNFGSPTPQLRFNAGLEWDNGAHSANIFVRHIEGYLDDQNCADGSVPNDDLFALTGCPGNEQAGFAVDSDTRVDIQYALSLSEYMNRDKLAQVTIGVRNLFGETPPQVFTNGGFDSRVHDPRGTLLYFGLDLEL